MKKYLKFIKLFRNSSVSALENYVNLDFGFKYLIV